MRIKRIAAGLVLAAAVPLAACAAPAEVGVPDVCLAALEGGDDLYGMLGDSIEISRKVAQGSGDIIDGYLAGNVAVVDRGLDTLADAQDKTVDLSARIDANTFLEDRAACLEAVQ